MKRRDVLKLAGAGTAGLVLPGGIDRWFLRFATPVVPGTDGSEGLEAALKRARDVGKPLLVLVIPPDAREQLERGRLFGGLLNNAGPETLADLVLCEVACAPMRALRDEWKVEGRSGDPLAVLVETENERLRGRALDPELPPQAPVGARGGRERDEAARSALERVARLAEALHAAVAPNRSAIAALAAAAEVGLSPEQKLALAAAAEGEEPIDVVLADRGAAILRLLAEDDPSCRKRVLEALRTAAIARLRLKAPSGSRWATSDGCRTQIEGEEPEAIDCGMGYVPDASRRFLWFFTDR